MRAAVPLAGWACQLGQRIHKSDWPTKAYLESLIRSGHIE